MDKTNYSVIIPAYNPDDKLLATINELNSLGVSDIILVNDGSKKECNDIFSQAKKHSIVTYLEHEVNRGKGAALKTAFSYIINNRPYSVGCITADADGQHRAEDIIACAEEMLKNTSNIILGVRDFSLPNIPARSRSGNKITSLVFKVFVGLKISDTQTGLRAIPFKYLPEMLNIFGDRYEYETNMLLEMKKKKIPFSEKIIETVYIEDNKSSHFNPIRDSWKIYKLILAHFFKYTVGAILSLIIEQLIQSGLYWFFIKTLDKITSEVFAFLPARIISSVFNFIFNKKVVFNDRSSCGRSLVRYYALWLCQGIVTMYLDWLFVNIVFATSSVFIYTLITLVIKACIAIISFRIQKDWVFLEN